MIILIVITTRTEMNSFWLLLRIVKFVSESTYLNMQMFWARLLNSSIFLGT